MACKNVCRLCDKLIISTAVAVNADGVIITIPSGSYRNGGKYCIIIAQTIPTSATITMPVFIQVGTGGTEYPLVKRNCRQVTACGIRTRTKYSVCVETEASGGLFRMLGRPCCSPDNSPAILGE
ncbi:MAG: hypothetical protein ACI3XQ_06465 [Eubacteriales bacterium]